MTTDEPSTTLPAGTRVGSYEVVRFLARGGTGVVYLARHKTLGETVALKVLYPHLSGDPDFAKRFEREVSALARLKHPNIVNIMNAETAAGQQYMAMQYAVKGTLRDLLERANNRQLSIKQALSLTRQIALALQHAHQNGVIHRDIKPGNVLLDADWRVLLSDFGIAHLASAQRLTQFKASLGTPEYMSPEQGKGEVVDARSDLYSLGVVLYEMLAGKPPFSSDNHLATLFQHSKEAPTQITRYRPDVPPAVRKLVHKALAKNPRDRFPNAAAMITAIDLALQGKGEPSFALKPAVMGAAGLAGLLLAAGAVMLALRPAASPAPVANATPQAAVRATATLLPPTKTGGSARAVASTAASATPLPSATPLSDAAGRTATPDAPTVEPTVTEAAYLSAASTVTVTAQADSNTSTPGTPAPLTGATSVSDPRASVTPRTLANNRLPRALTLVLDSVYAERWGRPPQWQNAEPNVCAYLNSSEDIGGRPVWRFFARIRLSNTSRERIRLEPGSLVLQGDNGYAMLACMPGLLEIEPRSDRSVTVATFFEGDRLAPFRIGVPLANQTVCFVPLADPANLGTDKLGFQARPCP
jgi:hypothetical protein